MTTAPQSHLDALYAATDDPWAFRSSAYEQERFDAVVAALPAGRFAAVLEIGCGNGELARRIAPRCGIYTGLDAAEVPLDAARRAVPQGRFLQAYLPCDLPAGDYDLILLSEILYFLDPGGIGALAAQIDARWPIAHLMMVNYRGPSGNLLECEAALALFLASLDARRGLSTPRLDPAFRIDVAAPIIAGATALARPW
ncbi:MAG: SAM-dependent methyltransferase [Paracoccaceae bacterium]